MWWLHDDLVGTCSPYSPYLISVRVFVCAGTVEDKILQLQERKRAMAETALGDGVGGLRAAAGRLTMQDLQFLFSGM